MCQLRGAGARDEKCPAVEAPARDDRLMVGNSQKVQTPTNCPERSRPCHPRTRATPVPLVFPPGVRLRPPVRCPAGPALPRGAPGARPPDGHTAAEGELSREVSDRM